MTRNRCVEYGFTLVEIILVIVVVGAAIVMLGNVTTNGFRQNQASELLTAATALANEKMEQIVADKNSQGWDYVAEENYPFEASIDHYPLFQRKVEIALEQRLMGVPCKIVEIKVKHPHLREVTLMTMVSNY